MLTFICYPKCSTCQKAKALLDSHELEYESRDIKANNPTYDELKAWLVLSELPVRKFFNTSGLQYKALGLKNKLPSMSDDECLGLLATDGMLVKRPLLVDDDGVLVGFDSEEWETVLKNMPSFPAVLTLTVINSRDIKIPYEWFERLGFGLFDYAQLSLVDDKIAVHKPVDVEGTTNTARKISDTSYIRRIDFVSGVRPPDKLLRPLDIKDGDKVDVTFEENHLAIRKHPNEPIVPEPGPPEPQLAFCCVCGQLLYTRQSLVKVQSKYICHDCIDVVKAL